MNKYEEKANKIIDRVSEVIEEYYPEIKPKHLTDDDSIENPALINGDVYYDLELEIADIIKSDEENDGKFFQIPFMIVHRDDVIAQFQHKNNFEEMKNKIQNMSNKEMQNIADNMTDMMMEQFNLALKIAFETQLELEEDDDEDEV